MGEGRGGGTVMGEDKFHALKYAHDFAIVAEEAEGSGKMLERLDKFVERAKMKVNVQKTKIIVFRNG